MIYFSTPTLKDLDSSCSKIAFYIKIYLIYIITNENRRFFHKWKIKLKQKNAPYQR